MRGKAITTSKRLLFRFALARSSNAYQIKLRLPDLVACQTFMVNPIPPRPPKAVKSNPPQAAEGGKAVTIPERSLYLNGD